MTLRLTTLCENTAGRFGYIGEWGLSILVAYGKERILLDTGMSDTVVHNARLADIDLNEIYQVVFSHGHMDHTGGVRSLLHQIRHPVDIYAHPDVWGEKYSMRPEISGGHQNFVGIPFQQKELEYLGASFHFSKDPVQLSRHMMTTGEVPMVTDFEHIDANLYVKTDIGFEPDRLADDQALIVKTPGGLIVILGCAHRGMINTLLHARNITGTEKIKAVVGGTHLLRATDHQLSRTAEMLKALNVEKIGVSHCTGLEPAIKLARIFGEDFFFNNAGTVVAF